MIDPKLIESTARLIDPNSWFNSDSYRSSMADHVSKGLCALTIKGVSWMSLSGWCNNVTLHATVANGTIGVEYFDPATGCEIETGAITMPTLSVQP